MKNYKAILKQFFIEEKNLIGKVAAGGKLVARECLVLTELERLTRILRGERDPGPWAQSEVIREFIDVSKPAIHEWRSDGYPISENDAIPVKAVIQFMRRKWTEEREEAIISSPALERKREADADIREMERDVRKGLLVSVEVSTRTVFQILSACWTKVQQFRDKLPGLCVNKTALQIRNIIIEETERAGEEVIKKLESIKKENEKIEETKNPN